MPGNSPQYKEAVHAAARYAKAYGMRPLFALFEKFGVNRIQDVPPVNLPAFIAACWIDFPRLRRVK
jgi:hypothetical protein